MSTATDVVGLCISAVGFGATVLTIRRGLKQYRRAQEWKRAEFIATEMKAFLSTPSVANAMVMMDWSARRVDLFSSHEEGRATWPVVTRKLLTSALLPHPVKGAVQRGHPDDAASELGDVLVEFSREEAAIRDCFDAFLDGLERFASFLQTDLITPEGLRPYLFYWIEKIATSTNSRDEVAWRCSLLSYIAFYRYDGVQRLFDRFGYEIRPAGDPYRASLLELRDRQSADKLASLFGITPAPGVGEA